MLRKTLVSFIGLSTILVMGCSDLVFADAVTQDYMRDMEPIGRIVPQEDFYYPYLVTLLLSAFVTLYLGYKGFFNLAREGVFQYYEYISNIFSMRVHTFWLLDKFVSIVLWITLLLPFLLYIYCLVEVVKINNLILSAGLEGFMLALGIVLMVGEEKLNEFWTGLKGK